MSDDIRQNALSFEAIKVSMNQDKNGIILRLNVHPNDCPKELHTDWVGTRYMVAMVRLNDEDMPDTREDQVIIERLIASCGLLCRNEDFFSYMFENDMVRHSTIPVQMEMYCIEGVRNYCNIKSRTEFRDNVSARDKFVILRDDFKAWKRG